VNEPLCGREWLEKNKDKVTIEDIEAQAIEIKRDGKRVSTRKTKINSKGGK